jgi:hypothetical protein
MPALKVWVANERLTSTDLNANFASVQQPDGVVASAANTSTQSTPITLNAVVEGKASYLSGGRIVTPRAGLYLVSGLVTVTATATGPHTFALNGAPLDFAWFLSSSPVKFSFAMPLVLGSGVQITGQFATTAGGAPTCTIHRLGFLFLGTGYAP